MIIIHGVSLSPFVRKALVVADEKGLAYENRPSRFGQPDEDFLRASPFRKIPALAHGDFTVADSSAIIHYLEAIQPEPSMIPTEAKARARTIWYEEFADTILAAAAGTIFFNRFVAPKVFNREGDLGAAEKAEREALPPIYDYLESQAPSGGFLVEDRFTLADIAVASPFVNLAHLGVRPDSATYPRLTAYLASVHARPTFAKYIGEEGKFFGG